MADSKHAEPILSHAYFLEERGSDHRALFLKCSVGEKIVRLSACIKIQQIIITYLKFVSALHPASRIWRERNRMAVCIHIPQGSLY